MEITGKQTSSLFALTVAVVCGLLFTSCETTSTVGTATKSSSSRVSKKRSKSLAKTEKKADPIRKNKDGKIVAVPVMLIGVQETPDDIKIVEPKPVVTSDSPIILASAGNFNKPATTPAFATTLRPAMVPPGGMMMVRTTAYCHKEADHIVYGRKNAIDGTLQYGGLVRSAAADWSKYPVGTRFRITGLPYEFVVDDYGSALVGTGTIDIYQPSFAAMNAWGVRNVPIQVIQWGSFEMSRKILAGRAHVPHAGHVRTMLREIERKASTSASVKIGNRKAAGEA